MELRVRKLIEKDFEFLPQWWNDWKLPDWPRDMLPGAWLMDGQPEKKREGLGGFMVCKGEDPIAAMWLFLTNSKLAIPAVCISDRYYKDADRSEALQLLVDFVTDFAKDMGYRYVYAPATPGKMLRFYESNGYHKNEVASYEMIKRLWDQ